MFLSNCSYISQWLENGTNPFYHKEVGKGKFPSLREKQPPTEITREFTKDGRKGEVKLKTTEGKPKEKSRTHPGPRSVLEPQGPSRISIPSEVLACKGYRCSFCDRQICQLLWHQNTADLSWCLPLLLQSICSRWALEMPWW